MAGRAVWEGATGAVPPAGRGFDDDRIGLSHFAVPEDGALVGGLVDGHVRGSFAAIQNLSAWQAQWYSNDPEDVGERARAACVAGEIEELARALRRALGDHESEE